MPQVSGHPAFLGAEAVPGALEPLPCLDGEGTLGSFCDKEKTPGRGIQPSAPLAATASPRLWFCAETDSSALRPHRRGHLPLAAEGSPGALRRRTRGWLSGHGHAADGTRICGNGAGTAERQGTVSYCHNKQTLPAAIISMSSLFPTLTRKAPRPFPARQPDGWKDVSFSNLQHDHYLELEEVSDRVVQQLYFMEEETGAQRGHRTSPRSQSTSSAGAGLPSRGHWLSEVGSPLNGKKVDSETHGGPYLGLLLVRATVKSVHAPSGNVSRGAPMSLLVACRVL